MTLRSTLKNLTPALLTALVTGVLLLSVGRGDGVSPLRVAAGELEQDLVRWELTHFMDKWLHRAADILLFRGPSQGERQAAIDEFFGLRSQLSDAQSYLDRTVAAPSAQRERTPEQAQLALDAVQRRSDALQADVEETIEGALSGVLHELGIIDGIGPARWPPVDFTFERDGLVLVRSPRDAIVRLDDLLLDPDVSVLDQIALENEIEQHDPASVALVLRIGGVATYPAQVSPDGSLHRTLELGAHEWLHHWLMFRPLGPAWFDGGELQSINETVANIVGEEVGDLTLTKLTGEIFPRAPWEPPTIAPREKPADGTFDFTREMRRTRVDIESLLGDGKVDGAKTFLEERRLVFVANGFHLRKLNNAWFAFHGTYADGPGSISPIDGQLRTVRAASADLAGFLDRVSGISKEGELASMAIDAGWKPTDVSTGLPLDQALPYW